MADECTHDRVLAHDDGWQCARCDADFAPLMTMTQIADEAAQIAGGILAACLERMGYGSGAGPAGAAGDGVLGTDGGPRDPGGDERDRPGRAKSPFLGADNDGGE